MNIVIISRVSEKKILLEVLENEPKKQLDEDGKALVLIDLF